MAFIREEQVPKEDIRVDGYIYPITANEALVPHVLLPVLGAWEGKTLLELNVRARWEMHVSSVVHESGMFQDTDFVSMELAKTMKVCVGFPDDPDSALKHYFNKHDQDVPETLTRLMRRMKLRKVPPSWSGKTLEKSGVGARHRINVGGIIRSFSLGPDVANFEKEELWRVKYFPDALRKVYHNMTVKDRIMLTAADAQRFDTIEWAESDAETDYGIDEGSFSDAEADVD